MKRKVYLFLTFAFFVLMIAPAVNLISNDSSSKADDTQWWSSSFLYNMDFTLPALGYIYYLFGISMDPGKVVIGKDGWLYLGDDYSKPITTKRTGATPQDGILAEQMAHSAASWLKWLKNHEVKGYNILIGPDKDSVYDEHLPKWAKHTQPSATDLAMKHVDPHIYINPLNALLEAKKAYEFPLYYKTDTHWNSLGAWIAFNQLAKNLSRTQPDIIWPTTKIKNTLRIVDRLGGDLSNFQRIQQYLVDHDVIIGAFTDNPITIEQYNFKTGELLFTGANPEIGAPREWLLVKSRAALNQKKVLWLRDSFGSAMAPFMALTFSETLQLHYGLIDSKTLATTVEEYRPDYVIVTAVERDFRGAFLISMPPVLISNIRSDFKSSIHSTKTELNYLSTTNDENIYKVTGIDPYVRFTLSDSVNPKNVAQIAFDISCDSKSKTIPVQLFWRSQNTAFNEDSSMRFLAHSGMTSVDFSTMPAWFKSEFITDIRLDLDLASPADCPNPTIKYLDVDIALDPTPHSPILISNVRPESESIIPSSKTELNYLSITDENDTYKITGIDPYITFTLSNSIDPKDVEAIAFEATCENDSATIPVQLFWRTKNTAFNEDNSIRFLANQGVTTTNISTLPEWLNNENITDIRLDLDISSPDNCPKPSIKYLEVHAI